MPTPTVYSYTISTDITAAKCNSSRLADEIADDPDITIALSDIQIDGDDLDITFKDELPCHTMVVHPSG